MGKRLVVRRTPGGRITVLIKKKKGKMSRCALCKEKLRGVARDHPRYLRKYPKSQKRVSRIFGGYLCHRCLERLIKEEVRKEALKILSTQ